MEFVEVGPPKNEYTPGLFYKFDPGDTGRRHGYGQYAGIVYATNEQRLAMLRPNTKGLVIQAHFGWNRVSMPTATWTLVEPRGIDARQLEIEKLSVELPNLSTPLTGADPEVFFEDALGQVVPAFSFLPKKFDGSQVFWDGFQGEFSPGVASCQDYFGTFMRACLAELQKRMPQGVRFSTRSVVNIPERTLETAATEHVGLGCSPSLNAYGLRGMEVPNPRDLPIRFAGGHIHYGVALDYAAKPDYALRCVEAVKMMDALVGLMSVSLCEGRDHPSRRVYYGLAGEYRLPKHGLEYRTLSNAWLASPSVYHLTFSIARTAARLGMEMYRNRLLRIHERDVVEAINTTNPEMARQLIREERDLWMKLLDYNFPGLAEETFELIQQPMDSFGVHLEDMESNWRTLGWSFSTPTNLAYPERWSTFLERRRNVPRPTIPTQSDSLSGMSGVPTQL